MRCAKEVAIHLTMANSENRDAVGQNFEIESVWSDIDQGDRQMTDIAKPIELKPAISLHPFDKQPGKGVNILTDCSFLTNRQIAQIEAKISSKICL